MKSNELRIGNLYNQFGNIESVNWAILKTLEEAPIEQIWCKPIPLTEEWLLKFGFELNSDEGDCKFYEKGKYGIRWVDGDEFYFYLIMNYRDEYWILKEIYDVHKLQNIWLDLTDEELTMKSE
jgi:hypothetical protein